MGNNETKQAMKNKAKQDKYMNPKIRRKKRNYANAITTVIPEPALWSCVLSGHLL